MYPKRRGFEWHPAHLAVEQHEREFDGLRGWCFEPEIDEQVVLSMEPSKLSEIAISLGSVGRVREILEAAQMKGRDVCGALAALPPRPSPEDAPWGE